MKKLILLAFVAIVLAPVTGGSITLVFIVLLAINMIPTGAPRGALLSTATPGTNTNNQLTVNYDYSKVFIGATQYATGDMTNGTGGDLTYPQGTLIGRISVSQELTPLVATAVDGSQFPVGILAEDIFIADTVTKEVPIGVAGRVVEGKVIFDGVEDFDTVVSGRSLRDRIGSDTVGIVLIVSTDNSEFDND